MIAQIFNVFFALDDPNVFIDIVLTALIVALIGCVGYVIFVESMQNDRDEIRAKKFLLICGELLQVKQTPISWRKKSFQTAQKRY